MIEKIKIYLFVSSMIGSLLASAGVLFGDFDILRFFLAGILLGYPVSFFLLVLFKKKGIKINELN